MTESLEKVMRAFRPTGIQRLIEVTASRRGSIKWASRQGAARCKKEGRGQSAEGRAQRAERKGRAQSAEHRAQSAEGRGEGERESAWASGRAGEWASESESTRARESQQPGTQSVRQLTVKYMIDLWPLCTAKVYMESPMPVHDVITSWSHPAAFWNFRGHFLCKSDCRWVLLCFFGGGWKIFGF